MPSQLGFEFEQAESPATTRPERVGTVWGSIHSTPSTSSMPSAGRARSLATRSQGQLTLTLDHRPHVDREMTIRGKIRIEEALRRRLGPRVIVELTGNRSTMISYNTRNGVLYVRAHAIFQDAGEDVLHAVASFVSGRRTSAKEARLIDDYIETHRHRIRRPKEKDLIIQPYGEVHDLGSSLGRLNRELFGGAIQATITWSRAAKNQRRSSIRMGSYCDEQKLIRIHPALDQAFVPLYFVESVIFHEMLHEHHGIIERDDGRRCIHSRDFLSDERRFPEYEEARRWERKHLSKLLRY